MNTGYAQALLKEKGVLPAGIRQLSTPLKWPVLEACLQAKLLSYIDYSLAKSLLDGTDVGEESAAFLCHLSMSVRQGHLCIRIFGDVGVRRIRVGIPPQQWRRSAGGASLWRTSV